MTDEEKLLKRLLAERAEGSFVSLEEGERRTREMIERKRLDKHRGRLPASERLTRNEANARQTLSEAIDESLAQVERGETISAEAVDEWLESWGTDNELPPPRPLKRYQGVLKPKNWNDGPE